MPREQILIPLPPGQKVRLENRAIAAGMSLSAYVRFLISQGLVVVGTDAMPDMPGRAKPLTTGETVKWS